MALPAEIAVFPPWTFRICVVSYLTGNTDSDATATNQKSSDQNGLGEPEDAMFGIALWAPWYRTALYYAMCLCSAGILWLIMFWFPSFKHSVRYTRTTNLLDQATGVIVVARNGKQELSLLRRLRISRSELRLTLPSLQKRSGPQDRNIDLMTVENGTQEGAGFNDVVETVIFEYRCLQFVFNIWSREFECITFDYGRLYPAELHNSYWKGVYETRVLKERLDMYGPACVNSPIQPLPELIVAEIFHPFYVFQMAAISLWLWDQYYQYAFAVLAITMISLLAEIIETRSAQLKLRKMARFVCDVRTLRMAGRPVAALVAEEAITATSKVDARSVTLGGPGPTALLEEQSSTLLVPGDVVELRRGMIMPCDMILLRGTVIINESMLTGESVPITKTALPYVGRKDGSPEVGQIESTYMLYGGTEIVDVRHRVYDNEQHDDIEGTTTTRERKSESSIESLVLSKNTGATGVFGLVIKTGFCTSQGLMMRSILHPPKKKTEEFRKDSYRFLAFLAIVAFVGFVVSIIVTLKYELKATVVVIRSLDTFTNAVPPALPVTMTVGSTIAVTKLKRLWKIMCIAPTKVNAAGQVNTIVFDKTGTLTEEGMDLQGVLAVERTSDKEITEDSGLSPRKALGKSRNSSVSLSNLIADASFVPVSLTRVMAICHGLSVIDERCAGDPIELELLDFTRWKMVEDKVQLEKGSLLAGANCPDAEERCDDKLQEEWLPCLAEIYTTNKPDPAAAAGGITPATSRLDMSCLQQQNLLDAYSKDPVDDYFLLSNSTKGTRRREGVYAGASPDCDDQSNGTDTSGCALLQAVEIVEDPARDAAVGRAILQETPVELWRIVRRYDFVPALQRMSVVTWDRRGKKLYVFCKGSPEQLVRLSKPETVPKNLEEILRRYTEKGMRVLALAQRELDLTTLYRAAASGGRAAVRRELAAMKREFAEREMEFCGIALFANMLKSGTQPAMLELRNAGCRALMATGDNALTATAVAREALIIDSASTTVVADVVGGRLVWTPGSIIGGSTTAGDDVAELDTVGRTTEAYENVSTTARGGKSSSCGSTRCSELRKVLPAPLGGSGSAEDAHKNDSDSKPVDTTQIAEYDFPAWLRGRDPREVVLIVTGPAFRYLKQQHEELNLAWAPLPPGADGDLDREAEKKCRAIRLANLRMARIGWQRVLARERRFAAKKNVLIPLNQNGLAFENYSDIMRTDYSSSDVSCHIAAVPGGDAFPPTLNDPDTSWKKQRPSCMLNVETYHCYSRNGKLCVDCKRCRSNKSSGAEEEVVLAMSTFEYVLRFCRVFARMAPDDKASLVTALGSLPAAPPVAMCGDGANDCAALRSADVGISLSEKEASIAAPFTATDKTVLSAVAVLRQGRGALTNSFQSFKYVALYALVQLMTTSILYAYGGNLSDPQYLWIDLVIVLPLTITMAWTDAAGKLTDDLPGRHLVGLPVLLSLLGQLAIQLIFLAVAMAWLSSTSFYERFEPDPDTDRFEPDDLACYENTVVFVVSNFQYIFLNAILAYGRPWRKHPITNWVHSVILALVTLISIFGYLTRLPFMEFLPRWSGLVDIPKDFTAVLVGIIVCNGLVSLLFERWVIARWCYRRGQRKDAAAQIIDLVLPIDKDIPAHFTDKEPDIGVAARS